MPVRAAAHTNGPLAALITAVDDSFPGGQQLTRDALGQVSDLITEAVHDNKGKGDQRPDGEILERLAEAAPVGAGQECGKVNKQRSPSDQACKARRIKTRDRALILADKENEPTGCQQQKQNPQHQLTPPSVLKG